MTALNIETVFNEVEEYYSHEIISRAKDLLYHIPCFHQQKAEQIFSLPFLRLTDAAAS